MSAVSLLRRETITFFNYLEHIKEIKVLLILNTCNNFQILLTCSLPFAARVVSTLLFFGTYLASLEVRISFLIPFLLPLDFTALLPKHKQFKTYEKNTEF